MFRIAEVALVTPMRDGMNLVAKEYVASRLDQRGVLTLSERAGAAREPSDAIIIHPTDMGQFTEAIHEALVMPEEEQITRMAAMQALVKRYNVFAWTKLFLNQLAYTKLKQHTLATEMLTGGATQQLLADYHAAAERLLLLDYDGTLRSFPR